MTLTIRYLTGLALDLTVTIISDACNQDYVLWTWIPFLVSMPFAMAARWTQRRGLFRPINGLQRLLMWSTLYPATMQTYQHYSNLRGLKAKRAIAKRIREKLGIDPLISKMIT